MKLPTFRRSSWVAAFGATCLATGVVWAQLPLPSVPDTAGDAVNTVQDTTKGVQDTANQATQDAANTVNDTTKGVQDAARDTTNAAQDTVRDTTKAAQDTARDTTKAAQDTARDTTKAAQDTARDTTKAAQDTVRDTTRDAQDTVRDTTRGARETARDAARDVRDTARDAARDVEGTARDAARDVRDATRDAARGAQDGARGLLDGRRGRYRGADIGVWFDTSVADGLVIADVDTNAALGAAGFREGDRIVSINGRRVIREGDFMRIIFDDNIRDRVPVIVVRDGQEQTIYLEPVQIRQRVQTVAYDPLDRFGIVFDDRYPDRLVVWRVMPRSPAFYAGIRPGDVLVSFSGQRLAGPQEFVQILGRTRAGAVQLQVNRNDRVRQLNIDLPNLQAQGEARTTLRPNLDTELEADANIDADTGPILDNGPVVDTNRGDYRRAPRRIGPMRSRRR